MHRRLLAAAAALILCAAPCSAETYTPGSRTISTVAENALPASGGLNLTSEIFDGEGNLIESYSRPDPIHFPSPENYAILEGITTFRGNNHRDGASFGSIGRDPTEITEKWSVSIGAIDSWSGVGWTGQCSIVKWPAETRAIMNLYPEKKEKENLTEVIYAALDGKIHFLDLDDGSRTRDPISIGAPIKGSVTVDPRGYPLLYCGQGIDEVGGKPVKIGTRIFSLIDSTVLHFIDGHDKNARRWWYAFDCAPLIDAQTDTMLQLGENGVFYTLKLNTAFDPAAGTISIAPETTKYVYYSPASKRLGMENSVAVYNNYAFFAENSGIIQCVDVNTMTPVWAFAAGDDTDASLALEETESGVYLYTNNELDLRGTSADCNLRRINALTGEEIWCINEPVRATEDNNGGAFATPAIGKNSLEKYVYFHVARTPDGGALICADKETGEVVWRTCLTHFGWSSPVCVYSDSGRGYVVVGSSSGMLRLLDGLTGEIITEINLKSNIEGSPAIFGNTLVVGTRGCRIIAVQFN